MEMENLDKEEIVQNFVQRLIESQVDVDPDILEAVDDNFFELL